MAIITIRNLDADIKTRLRVSAALHGCSMEEEARNILRLALQAEPQVMGMGSRIHQRYVDVFGDESGGGIMSRLPYLPAAIWHVVWILNHDRA
jgi:plasmid stability protein